MPYVRNCECMAPIFSGGPWRDMPLHRDVQDTACDAWKRLLDLIEVAADKGHEIFSPGEFLGREAFHQLVTLPPSIGKLTAVRELDLYGSTLVRLPPEIGLMTNLQSFDPYTSYRLHWFPYEITRCERLSSSRVSTRALYGNRKYTRLSLASRSRERTSRRRTAAFAAVDSVRPARGPHGYRFWSRPM